MNNNKKIEIFQLESTADQIRYVNYTMVEYMEKENIEVQSKDGRVKRLKWLFMINNHGLICKAIETQEGKKSVGRAVLFNSEMIIDFVYKVFLWRRSF